VRSEELQVSVVHWRLHWHFRKKLVVHVHRVSGALDFRNVGRGHLLVVELLPIDTSEESVSLQLSNALLLVSPDPLCWLFLPKASYQISCGLR